MIHRKGTVPVTEGVSGYPQPYNLGRGHKRFQHFSQAGGLTQFGVAYEMLDPGARSSQLHWHEREDECLFVIDGELTVVEGETETVLYPGDAATWKAGEPTGHTIRNDGTQPAIYLMVGTRDPDDVCHYPGIDLRLEPHEGDHRFVHDDGTPYESK